MEVVAESAFQLLVKKLLLVGYTERQRRIIQIIQTIIHNSFWIKIIHNYPKRWLKYYSLFH